MKFKIDENLPAEVTDVLQKKGFDSVSVLDQDMGDSTDDRIYQNMQTGKPSYRNLGC